MVDPVEPRPRRRRRLLIVLAGILAGLLAVALLVAFLVAPRIMRAQIERMANRNPERVLMETVSLDVSGLGKAEVEGLRLRGQNARCQWEVRVAHATARLEVLPMLTARRSCFDDIRARGVTVRVRFFPQVAGAPGSPHVAPIEGFPDGPLTYEQRPAKRERRKDPWTWEFTDAVAEEVTEVWIGPYRYEGSATARCEDVLVQVRHRLLLEGVGFDSASGRLTRGDAVVADALAFASTTEIDGWDWETDRPRDIAQHLTAHVKGTASLDEIGLNDAKLGKLDWITFGEGKGLLDIDAGIADGRLADGSTMSVKASSISVAALRFVVEGSAAVELKVDDPLAGESTGRFDVAFDDFCVHRQRTGCDAASLRGTGLRGSISTQDLDLTEAVERYDVAVTLPDTRVGNLAALEALVPIGLDLRFLAGSASVSGQMHANQAEGSGRVKLVGRNLEVDYQGRPFSGDIDLDGQVKLADYGGGNYDFSGTTLGLLSRRLEEGRRRGARQGSRGTITLPRATLDLDGPVRFSGHVDGKFDDMRPLWDVADALVGLPDLFRPIVKSRNVKLKSGLRFGPQLVDVTDLTLEGDGLRAKACVKKRGAAKNYVIWADAGMLQGGARFAHGERSIKLFAGEAWYAEHQGECGRN